MTIPPTPTSPGLTIYGADVSSLPKSEDKGGRYYSEAGTPGDALHILADHGVNYIRLKVWVNPVDGYNDKAHILQMAQRLAPLNLKLLVDFHYSDAWADPGKQHKPLAWQGLNFEQLTQAVYDHTFDVCDALQARGTLPDMVQVGNEIRVGMLWPDGNTADWDKLAALLTAGARAVKACSPATRVMLHLDEGGDNDLYRTWFDNAIERDVPFEVIGLSYYPYWHGTMQALEKNLNDLAVRYKKDLIIVETAFPFTPEDDDGFANLISTQIVPGYSFTPAGQAKFLTDLLGLVRGVPGGHGLGIFYWEPTWVAVPGNGWDPADPASGNGWENQALFDFKHRALPALSVFKNP